MGLVRPMVCDKCCENKWPFFWYVSAGASTPAGKSSNMTSSVKPTTGKLSFKF